MNKQQQLQQTSPDPVIQINSVIEVPDNYSPNRKLIQAKKKELDKLNSLKSSPTEQLSPSKLSIVKKQESKLDIIQRILNKPQKNRTESDLDKLVPYIKQIEFFSERDVKDQDFPDIVSCLTYEYLPAGKDVFEYGSIGEKFYIIIQGTVGVMIPNPDLKDFKKRYDDQQKQKAQEQLQEQLMKQQKLRGQQSPLKQSLNNFSPGKQISGSGTGSSMQQQNKNNFNFMNNNNMSELKLVRNSKSEWSSIQTRNANNMNTFGNKQSNSGLIGSRGVFDQQITLGKDEQKEQNEGNLSEVEDNEEDQDVNEDLEELDSDERREKEETRRKLDSKDQKRKSMNRLSIRVEDQVKLFIEFTQLKAGKSFGELALIKNRPRAATITCIEDCHFAVMSKNDYEKVLQKIELKKMQKIIDFLHQLPFFRVWTKTSLSKLHYSFEEKAFTRNQVVYREGDESSMVYIIKSGEFEVTKKFMKQETQEIDVQKFLGPRSEQQTIDNTKSNEKDKDKNGRDNSQQKAKKSIQSSNIQLASRLRNTETFKILLLGPGQMFGEDDVVHERPYTQTIICRSNTGIVFAMKSQEFFRKLKPNEDCWKIILTQVLSKDKQMRMRMNKIDDVFHRDILKTQETGKEKSTIQQQIYPTILQKYNMKLTQKRLDDFRETLKEIVSKQKKDGVVSNNTIELSSKDYLSYQPQQSLENLESPKQRTINKMTIISKNTDSMQASPIKLDSVQNSLIKSRNQKMSPNNHSPINNQNYQTQTILIKNLLEQNSSNQNVNNYNLTLQSQTALPQKIDHQSFHSQNPHFANRAKSISNQNQIQSQLNFLDNQRNLMSRTSQLKSRLNMTFHQGMMGTVGRSNNNYQKVVQQARSQERFNGSNQPDRNFTQIFQNTYDGQSKHMSVAHTLKPNHLVNSFNILQKKQNFSGISKSSMYKISPHLIKNLDRNNQTHSQFRSQSQNGTVPSNQIQDFNPNQTAQSFMNRRRHSKLPQQHDQYSLQQYNLTNQSNITIIEQNSQENMHLLHNNTQTTNFTQKSSSNFQLLNQGINKFTNEQITQQQMRYIKGHQQEQQMQSHSLGNIQIMKSLNKTSYL
eukprot:403342576